MWSIMTMVNVCGENKNIEHNSFIGAMLIKYQKRWIGAIKM